MRFLLVVTVVCSVLISMNIFAATSEYQGQELRQIKALSQQEIEGYLQGKGMGMAKAGELNNYPGPKHVLENADALALSAEQRQQTEALFKQMQSAAIALGEQLIAREKALDTAFAEQSINPDDLTSLTNEIAQLQGQLRAVHLQAHLHQRALLSQHQLHQYNELRGYHVSTNHVHQ